MLRGLDTTAFQRGEAIYQGLCINCHGPDGITPQLPAAPAFGKSQLKYGSDPYSMFLTVTKGNGLMAPQTWMNPAERYDVIHYIRQKFVKLLNPAYREVDAAYLAKLPKYVPPKFAAAGAVERDFGPALASQLERRVVSALTIQLPEKTTVSYDLHNMDLAGAWQGGFLDLSETQHSQLRGEGEPKPQGQLLNGLQRWFWGHDGTLGFPREGLLPRGPLPEKWFHYGGHYLHGAHTVLSYAIDGRDILELPGKQAGVTALVNTLSIGPGRQPLVLCVGEYQAFDENVAGLMPQDSPTVTLTHQAGAVRGQIAVVAADQDGKPGEFVAAAVLGDSNGMTWQLPGRYRLALNIPASDRRQTIQIVRYFGRGEVQVQFFAGLARHRALKEKIPDLEALIHGGPLRWAQVMTTRGTLGTNSTPYTLDTLTLP
ncbi:MAG: cytochrome c, partial [Pedosphaera parvula]|nr:cytochrome c [Pedosphaera parvula]